MAKMRRSIPFAFTPIPNHFLEFQMKNLIETDLRVYLTIMRMTWGFNKPKDTIAVSQICEKAGIPRRTVELSLKRLRANGHLKTEGSARRVQSFELLIPKNFKAGTAS